MLRGPFVVGMVPGQVTSVYRLQGDSLREEIQERTAPTVLYALELWPEIERLVSFDCACEAVGLDEAEVRRMTAGFRS